TFTIAGLILRLVLEEGLGIGQILAVTYTVAATAELRDRVRKRLRDALEDLRNKKSADEITAGFLKNAPAESLAKGISALDDAVQNFDEAQIFTIHGFCQRVLGESAFEAGALFDMELRADAAPLVDEIARDFWRQRFYTAPPLLSRLALASKKSYRGWARLLNCMRDHPGLRIFPPAGPDSSEAIGKRLEKKLDEILSEWGRSGTSVVEILTTHKSLSRAQAAFKPETVSKMLQMLLKELSAEGRDASPESLGVILRLCNSQIADKLLKDKLPPSHRMFDLCEEFSRLAAGFFNQLAHEFVDFARREMPLRKERLNVVMYDDLLTRVRDALAGPGGASFAAILGARYRAGLIDEFQDTDPIQYEIFHKIFGGEEHYLYLIGDPRQAIYSFRGADVFTYREAAREAARGFTLDTNWRSEKQLLNAVNLLFRGHPSLGEEINYHEVHSPSKPRREFRAISNVDGPSRLRFRYLPGDAGGGGINRNEAELRIQQAVVADIARLKAARVKLGDRALEFGDMAVLVPTNREAVKLQELMRLRGIKSVLQTERSVFKTPEAREMRIFLEGVLEPGRGHFLNAALTTPLIRREAGDIGPEEIEGVQRQKRLEEFLVWRGHWEGSGFMAMFRNVLLKEEVRERLVALRGGERKLANFLHLAELLHEAGVERKLTPEGLVTWIAEQARPGQVPDEHQLRLESDDDGVLIATIHKSKGLEFPVVFCPSLWNPRERQERDGILFHDPGAQGRITLELRDADEAPGHELAADRERFDESLRMMYVAVTRAQNLCYIYAGDIDVFENSPLARVIGIPPERSRLEMLAEHSGGDIGFTVIDSAADTAVTVEPPVPASGSALRARTFRGSIPQTRMIASFSSLTEIDDEEEMDLVETPEPESTNATFAALARFDQGVRTGLFWHDLLQHLDFRAPDTIAPLVADKLVSHEFGAVHADVVSAQVRNLLAAPLDADLKLERVTMRERISEAEFSFPIAPVNPAQLRAAFARHGLQPEFSERLGRLNFRPAEGFMRGFIDLMFRAGGRYYIVDWKSNWLGNSPANYDQPGLRANILRHYYFLQYHLYTVAADLFLRRRIPGYDYEKHFDGVFYIFLRGVDSSAPGRGVFRDRPSAALVADLRQTLTGGLR
ncbi:MAG TPA: exodeoxyribonuclease V subunit beta, partial [Chthoniobacteraceae bacterium]|nr:exodeoxyribonuclease V subunit beta [Chthoniobacteraceae bacterium]